MQGSALKRLHFIIKLSKLVVAIGCDENCFHNCVSPFSSGVNKRYISADHENWIEQHSKQDSYLIQRFWAHLLTYN